MAFTLTQLCEDAEFAFNPFYYKVESSNSGATNHKFIVDVYVADVYPSTTIQYVDRFMFPVRPGGYGLFSPASIVCSYLDNQLTPTATAFTICNASQKRYDLEFGEQYKVNPTDTGTTIFSGLSTSGSKFILNAVKQIDSGSLITDRNYHLNSQVKLLSDWNTISPKKIRFGEWETIGIYKMESDEIYIQTFDSASTQIGSFVLTNGYDSLVDRYDIGAGTANLNYSSYNDITSSLAPIISSDVDYYLVSVGTSSTQTSVEYGYSIDRSCIPYDLTRIAWLNSWGSYDYFTFPLIKRTTVQRTNNEWERFRQYGDASGSRGRANLNVELTEKFIVNSDWLNDFESSFLMNCFNSLEHFLINQDGSYTPLIMVDKEKEPKTIGTDKLFNFSFTFEKAFNTNTQRT